MSRGGADIDVAVLGAGPVGATVAALCCGAGVEIEVFESRPGVGADARTLALSHASRVVLEDVQAWPADGVTAITSIHVSQKGGPGRTLIHASDQRLPALGYTLSFARLQQSLHGRLAQVGVPVRYGHECNALTLESDGATLRFAFGEEVRAKLLVLADGGGIATTIPGIAFHEKDYSQVALVAAVETDRPHGGRAYERFTREGPIALLPVGERYALVWTSKPGEASRRLTLADAAFLSELQEEFGDRAGRFLSVTGRAAFPLKLRAVNTPVALRTVIVGNAAQALHPIAGQGLNLGLRDAVALAEVLSQSSREAIGQSAMLDAYRAARRRDTSTGILFTDFLVSVFAARGGLPNLGRGIGLALLDLFPPARRLMAERMIHGAPRR